MFSRRTREYMVSYLSLDDDNMSHTPVNLDHLNKARKGHTDVKDISFSWISAVMRDIVSAMKEKK